MSQFNNTLDILIYALVGAMTVLLAIALIVYLVHKGPVSTSSDVAKQDRQMLTFQWKN